MKRIFKGVFLNDLDAGSSNDILVLSEIKDMNDFYYSKIGTVNKTKRMKQIGDFKEGDIIQFEADIKEIVFSNPTNIRKVGKKSLAKSNAVLEKVFGIKT